MKEKVEAFVDTREDEGPEIGSYLDTHDDVESWSPKELPAGDIEVGGVGFERKTPSDYVKSIMDNRLTTQCRKMGERYQHAYILYEGDLVETESPFRSSMKGASIRGSMASLTARPNSGVHAVLCCSNMELLVDTAVRLARKHIEEKNDVFLPESVVEPSKPTAMRMYGCIDGVGPHTAEKLYERFPTITEFIEEADYESLTEVEGIGKGRALTIIESLIES